MGRQPTQADSLIELAEAAELFHTPDGVEFMDFESEGHRETWPVSSRGARNWLTRRFYQCSGKAPSSEAMQMALSVIKARAQFESREHAVHLRVGGSVDRFYLDLGDPQWTVLEIDAAGWRVVPRAPVRFRRVAGMLPLPMPSTGGSIDLLRPYLNVRSQDDFVLATTWTLACLVPQGPYPVLVLSGEQGSAKSTLALFLRSLVDPNSAPLRALARDEKDLFIAARNGHVLAFDNVSGIPLWTSDALCRISSGGGLSVRRLYTDQDEILFDVCRPIILNGIEDVVTRADLADRAIFLRLQPIPEEHRRTERELRTNFEADRPQILGALLEAASRALVRLPETRLEKLPRMADFALLGTACETAFWPPGTFAVAYRNNRDEAIEDVVESDPIAAAVRSFMAKRTEWTGTASDLLPLLAATPNNRDLNARYWPDSPRSLSGRLRRAATPLRKIGIELNFDKKEGRARNRIIEIVKRQDHSVEESDEDQPSATSPNASVSGQFPEREAERSSVPSARPSESEPDEKLPDQLSLWNKANVEASSALSGTTRTMQTETEPANLRASAEGSKRWRGRL